jgi:hypothetical protein
LKKYKLPGIDWSYSGRINPRLRAEAHKHIHSIR